LGLSTLVYHRGRLFCLHFSKELLPHGSNL
jgi:hypothetical protein